MLRRLVALTSEKKIIKLKVKLLQKTFYEMT